MRSQLHMLSFALFFFTIKTKTWGSVEWQHGIEEQDLIARLSAVNLLYRLLNSSSNYCESL